MGWYRFKKNGNGYQVFKDKEGKEILIHRRVCEKKYKNIPPGFIVHHIDGDKTNNRPDNLILLHPKDHYRVHVKKDLIIRDDAKYVKNKKVVNNGF